MTSNRVAIIDTSLMCCWLRIPGRDTVGSEPDRWDHHRTDSAICSEIAAGRQLVFPITTLIEAGNFSAQTPHSRREAAQRLSEKLREALSGSRPWSSFTEQFTTIHQDALTMVCDHWPDEAAREVSIGDYLIKSVADYYGRSGFDVNILSSDSLLRSHVPAEPEKKPRRRGG